MHRPVIRAVASLLVTPFVVFGLRFVPEHVHETDDHHAPIAHSHPAADHLASVRHHRAGSFIDHDDHEQVVWLDSFAVEQFMFHGALFTPSSVEPFEQTTDLGAWSRTSLDKAAPPHGPPRASSSLRGPPSYAL